MNTSLSGEAVSEQMQERVHRVLNDLIRLNRDAVNGYKMAAELLEHEQYSEICRENAEQREQFIVELTHMMNYYEGVPVDAQSFTGLLHDAWIGITNMVSSDDGAVLAECDRGEEVAVDTYHRQLSEALPEDVDALIRAQFFLLKGSQERIHRLSDALAQ